MTSRLGAACALLIFLAVPADADDPTASIRAADLALDKATAERDVEAFKALIAADAVFLGGSARRGPAEVAASWAAFFDPASGWSLRWKPVRAGVAASGEIGWTIGDYTLNAPSADGPVTDTGQYFTVWRRSDDGRWRVAADGSLLSLTELLLEPGAKGCVDWEPTTHRVSDAGDMAFTSGQYRSSVGGKDVGGTYFRIWTKKDDAWSVVGESGTPPQ